VTEPPRRSIVDTNVILSWILFSTSIPAEAFRRARDTAHLLASDDTIAELFSAVARPKFDRYLSKADRDRLCTLYREEVHLIQIQPLVQICRDPRDNKFLDLTLSGQADILLTGDADLLSLHPFQKTAVLSPADFLAL